MILRIENHPTDGEYLVLHTPPEFAHAMGRFAAARRSRKLNAYVIRADLLDQLRTFARHENASILDERDRGEEAFSGPLPECRSCGMPARRKASQMLNRCVWCGDAWHPVIVETPGFTTVLRHQCEACGHRQGVAGRFCGDCGAQMPLWPPPDLAQRHAAEHAKAAAARARQDPLPIGNLLGGVLPPRPAFIDDTPEEEPERERYP